MAKIFVNSGNTYRVRDASAMQAFDDLPVGTYTVKFDDRAGEFFLEEINDFTLPSKIYGKNTPHAERIINTFGKRPGQTGVMLNGIKGAGKTLLAKQVSVLGREHGYPTIVINRDWHGDEFNSFIQSITTPTIIMFDEFEKVYNWDTQRKILTLFDGVFNSRKLFLVTSNTERDVSEFMKNRPGRIYYSFQFDTLGQDFIQEYLDDNLDDKNRIEEVLKYTQVFSFFNFDMLAAVVEEMNRYNEPLAAVLDVLNIQPENRSADTYTVDIEIEGKTFNLQRGYTGFQPNSFEYRVWTDSDMPRVLQADEDVMFKLAGNRPANSNNETAVIRELLTSANTTQDDDLSFTFNPTHITGFDQNTSTFTYTTIRFGYEVLLHVTRNKAVDQWKYNPDAL